MNHMTSIEDRAFRKQVEACEFPVPEFDHRAHVRLAYSYLVEHSADESVRRMRNSLIALLKHAGVEPAEKYHETMTEAWIRAVHYFMTRTDAAASADEFIDKNTVLLDAKILLTHYSAAVLFSDRARKTFVAPDLDPIPEHVA